MKYIENIKNIKYRYPCNETYHYMFHYKVFFLLNTNKYRYNMLFLLSD